MQQSPGNLPAADHHDVLVVEDDPEINGLVGAYAEIAGFQYRSALTGNEAVAEVLKSLPSLIVLDLMLPDLSGWDVCKMVRKYEDGHHVPVIILSALDNSEARQEARGCGIEEYLTKPFDPDALIATLRKHGGEAR